MESATKTTPTVGSECATLYVALELSTKNWVVLLRGKARERPSLHKLAAGDGAGLLALIDRAVERLQEGGTEEVGVVSCYEAGRDGFWLHYVLLEHGVENHVIDAASIAVPQGRRRKTDRIDVHGLLRELIKLMRGEGECRGVAVPTAAEEDARRPGRERRRLVKERGGHVNRIMGLCALHGILDYRPLRRDRRARLAVLRTARGEALPRHLAQEIARELERLELVLAQLKQVEAERERVLHAPPPPDDPGVAKIALLVKVKAIASETATTFTRELFFHKFNNQRQVGAFVGLDNSPWRSGRLDRDQGISKAGNKRVREAAIELAWRWPTYQPSSALTQWFLKRTAGAKGIVKRKMIVALARKLVIALWRYVEFGLVPTGVVFKPQPAPTQA